MEQKPPRPMTPFDQLVNPPSLYSLKLFLPYTPPSLQRFLAIYIKFLELRYTMEYFRGFPSHPSQKGMLSDLKPYLDEQERNMMEQAESMMSMMEMVQQMQSMAYNSSDQEWNPMDLMKGMLTPEQQEMFDTYNKMFEQGMNPSDMDDKKGGPASE